MANRDEGMKEQKKGDEWVRHGRETETKRMVRIYSRQEKYNTHKNRVTLWKG